MSSQYNTSLWSFGMLVISYPNMYVILVIFENVYIKLLIDGNKVLWLLWGDNDAFDQPGWPSEWQ